MTLRPYWQYYKDCFPYILASSLICFFLWGLISGLLVFLTIAVWIGIIAVAYFKPEEYYFYANLGITKRDLYTKTFVINLFVAFPVLLLFVLTTYIFGNLTII